MQEHLRTGEEFLSRQNFVESIRENEAVLTLSAQRPPADKALYNLGLLYAHSENPEKDYEIAIYFFDRLLAEFPESTWGEHARVWIAVLEEIQIAKGNLQEIQNTNESLQRSKKKDDKRRKSTLIIEAQKHLRRGQEFFAQDNFERSLKEFQTALSLSPQQAPGDKALFNMALLFAHENNPAQDYKISLEFFRMLVGTFPQSSLIEQAQIWVDVLQKIEGAKQVDIEIDRKKKELIR